MINLLDVLTDRGVLEEGERVNVLSAAINDLEGNTVSNNDAQRVIAEIWKARYPAVSYPVGSHRSRRPPSLPRHAVPRLSHRFNDGCVTFGQSHGPAAIHISAIEDWAEPEFGPD